MRILLAHNSLYYPSHGGGDKSNRLLMEALAARGHSVRVAARIERFGPQGQASLIDELARRGIAPEAAAGAVRFELRGVDVHTLTLDAQMRAFFSRHIEQVDPDVILTSTDDPAQLLFEIAIRSPRARVVHLVRATIAVPFGPDSSMVSASRSALLRRANAVVGVSEYVARYIREEGGIDAVHVPISLMEPGEFPDVGRFENEYVTLVNPCAVKGIAIFTALAAQMPHLRFAAVPTWGTNAQDLVSLRAHANIDVLDPMDNIDDLLRRTRVLLAPSLWAEARSRIIVEAMLRGVPVIASDIGGIPEAKLGVPYLIPVTPISSYKPAVDENMVPVAEVPPQHIEPWVSALSRLTSDADHWGEIARASRSAALHYVESISVEPFERLLMDVLRRPKDTAPAQPASGLSPEKQRLLALRLKQKSWFPQAAPVGPGKVRLFCFPYAGGGTRMYRSWANEMGEEVVICPALLPGRESRINEPPFENMTDLIAALSAAIRAYLDVPFAFFGHSMGAGIAFEFARSLRREKLPLPRALLVSAARAPQSRLNYTPAPEPSDDELLRFAPDDAGTAQLALPMLRADTHLYRHYCYTPEAPFDFPLFAYGGSDDPNVRPEHLEQWREQTRGRFIRREFRGGHFYLRAAPEFLTSLRGDIQALVTGDS
jgi:surfactin synthase thioesterase subunit/glycosyltransferase involved in cell wall biosynthesis